MFALTPTIDANMTGGLLVSHYWSINPPAIYWTPPLNDESFSINLDQDIALLWRTDERALTAVEEDLLWAALRAGSQLVQRL